MTDARIDRLEKQVRRLTLALVGVTGFAVGAVMMGAGSPSGLAEVYQGSAAGAPGGGFVVVPTDSGWRVMSEDSKSLLPVAAASLPK